LISWQYAAKKARPGFAGIVWLKAPDLPCSPVLPVRITHIATAMPYWGVGKMTARKLLEITLFPRAKAGCRKADA